MSASRMLASVEHTGAMLTECTSCHAQKKPAGLIHKFDHALPSAVGDCASCHAQSAGRTWTGGTYLHPAALTSCLGCHIAEVPAGVVPGKELDHAAAVNVTVSPVGKLDTAGLCSQCHTQPGVAWSGAIFHDNYPVTTLKACSGCHTAQLPTAPVGASGFDHKVSGTGDCYYCHASNPAVVGVNWTGGQYSHSPVPANCSSCHVNQRPVGPSGTPPFDHASGGMGDCVLCHSTDPAKIGQVGGWTGGQFNHTSPVVVTSCNSCHSSEMPGYTSSSTPVASTKTPAAGYGDPLNPSSCNGGSCKVQFDHSFVGSGDCNTCHSGSLSKTGILPAVSSNWNGGTYTHPASVASCNSCHLITLNSLPTKVLGTPQYDHAQMGTMDCATCHRASVTGGATTSWAGGVLNHTAMNTSTNCASCHTAAMPSGASPGVGALDSDSPVKCSGTACTIQFVHSATFLGGADCSSCHQASVSGNPAAPVNWTGGTYNHGTTTTSCNACHSITLSALPTKVLGNPSFDHSGIGTSDCFGCHKTPGTQWSGAGYFHSSSLTSCSSCHDKAGASDRPSSTVAVGNVRFAETTILSPAPASIPGSQYVHAGKFASGDTADCAVCHLSAIPAGGGNPARWAGVYNHKDASGVLLSSSSTAKTCNECHALQLPTVGTRFQMSPWWSTATDMTTSSYFHTAAFNGTADCSVCHLAKPANLGVTFTAAFWDHKTSSGTVIANQCQTCHQHHNNTKDCSTCHKATASGARTLIPTTPTTQGYWH